MAVVACFQGVFTCSTGPTEVTETNDSTTVADLGVLDRTITQQEFARLVGISPQAVGHLVKRGALQPGDTAREWLTAYLARLQDQAEQRQSDAALELSREKALLAHAQMQAQTLRNAELRSQYAPRELLEDLLRLVSAAVDAELEQLPDRVASVGLPDVARHAVSSAVAGIRKSWSEQTARLQAARPLGDDGDPESEPEPSAASKPPE